MEKRSVRTFDHYITSINKKKIYWVRFDQKVGYVLVDWVRFDQKSGYVLTKIGYVLVGYVLAWVRFDLHPCKVHYLLSTYLQRYGHIKSNHIMHNIITSIYTVQHPK